MINAPSSSIVIESVMRPSRRISPGKRFFWLVFALEALLIAGVCVAVINALPSTRLPLTATGDYDTVRQAVLDRLQGAVADPLIDVQPGVTARSSNVRGFTLHNVTYYYYVDGEQNFDPLSRSVVQPDQVEIVQRDTKGPMPIVIYTLVSK